MQKFTNPLDSIKIASPCSADWNKMYGDNRKRHCSECKLNVYNLSDMTRGEAETFLVKSEGKICMQVRRRKDGTVLTKDCPVGWRNLKKRISHIATASLALIFGVLGGILSLESLKSLRLLTNYDKVPEIFFQSEPSYQNEPEEGEIRFGGLVGNLREVQEDIMQNRQI